MSHLDPSGITKSFQRAGGSKGEEETRMTRGETEERDKTNKKCFHCLDVQYIRTTFSPQVSNVDGGTP